MSEVLIQLMEDNLNLVWCERDKVRRLNAIKNIYAVGSGLYHVGHKDEGYECINESADAVINGMPANFVFTKLKPVIINNSIGRLIWGVGPEGKPPVATGMDIAHFEKDKIKSLYVFLD